MAKNYYDILRVAEDANEEAIRKGYRKAMREKHSDLHSGDDASADRRVRELNAARDTLTNPELRRKYDQQLQKMKKAAKAPSTSQASDSTPPTRTEPGNGSSDPDAAEQQPFVNTGSEFRTAKPWSATTRSRRSFATTGLGIVSILFGGVAGIYNRALSAREVEALYDYESSPRPKPTTRTTGLRRKSTTPPLAVVPFDERQAKAHQKVWARHLGTRVEITNSIGMKLNLIPPGEFMMGSPESEHGRRDNETQHRVRITKPFYLSATEVTQSQYEDVMGKNPSHSKGANKPVEKVNWNDAVEFCEKLSKREGEGFRLPTEAEWEYACRAGTPTAYSFGDDASKLGQYAWHRDNSGNTTHVVRLKLPNPWGLYDMHGNVYEWCQDWYEDYGNEKVVIDPTGPVSGGRRVLRGGAFLSSPRIVLAANRDFSLPGRRYRLSGFRLARTCDLSP